MFEERAHFILLKYFNSSTKPVQSMNVTVWNYNFNFKILKYISNSLYVYFANLFFKSSIE